MLGMGTRARNQNDCSSQKRATFDESQVSNALLAVSSFTEICNDVDAVIKSALNYANEKNNGNILLDRDLPVSGRILFRE